MPMVKKVEEKVEEVSNEPAKPVEVEQSIVAPEVQQPGEVPPTGTQPPVVGVPVEQKPEEAAKELQTAEQSKGQHGWAPILSDQEQGSAQGSVFANTGGPMLGATAVLQNGTPVLSTKNKLSQLGKLTDEQIESIDAHSLRAVAADRGYELKSVSRSGIKNEFKKIQSEDKLLAS